MPTTTPLQSLDFSPALLDAPPRVCVIAEIGVNHDGNVQIARELIAAAVQAGADAVKLQHFCPERLLSNQALLAEYQQTAAQSQQDLLSRLALPLDQLRGLAGLAEQVGLAMIVTPFSLDDVRDLASINLQAVKIASPDAVNTPLLEAAAGLNKPLIVSTGTCTLDELAPAASILAGHAPGGAMLHCVSSYPTPPEHAGLSGIAQLAGRFSLTVGYSDHTALEHTGALAVAAGAVILEKHLTYDRQAAGPDHAASLEPQGLARYIKQVRQAQAMLGPQRRDCEGIEADVRRVSRQSLCARKTLPAGHILGPEDLTLKRPGTGIPASKLPDLLGRTLSRQIMENDLIHYPDVT